ncbi:hypothetical protein [Allostreptomyces psammosilenae]|uniref:Uncharacterized protein n=1 Tax=Allostreptomyces psammosilenae TaxID=1892865 RepID=A0A853A1T2_9ACTN|nr:hypothetical protein [Allostreptomyces psammosilenae]NYI08097.1 hypothetical protein [Allostreptomyces psammosilenae]
MDTTSRAEAASAASATAGRIDTFLSADFPWYGLDEGWTGARWLGPLGVISGGTVEHGTLGHGDRPSRLLEEQHSRRFVCVVTLARRPLRRTTDGTGTLEATSVGSAAWLAGSGLLSCTWPGQLDRSLRQDWLDQQSTLAWELSDDLTGPAWSTLTLPVGGVPQPFHYRESDYGWVLAGEGPGVHLGAYGRGVSAYGLGFAVRGDLSEYREQGPATA